MNDKKLGMTKGQVEYEYAVAMSQLLMLNRFAESGDAEGHQEYINNRRDELRRWIDVLKTAYIEYGENVADIPF